MYSDAIINEVMELILDPMRKDRYIAADKHGNLKLMKLPTSGSRNLFGPVSSDPSEFTDVIRRESKAIDILCEADAWHSGRSEPNTHPQTNEGDVLF